MSEHETSSAAKRTERVSLIEARDRSKYVQRIADQNDMLAAIAGDLERMTRAFNQACMNLAVLRPRGRDTSLGEDAEAWAEALLDGLGSPW